MKDEELIEAVKKTDARTIVLSTKVILQGRQVNPLVLTRLMSKTPRPHPPKVFMKVMGREMENPDDPEYIDALKQWKVESSDSLATAMILLGTSLESKPDDMPGPDDEAWQFEYRLLGFDIVDNAQWRYLNWVRFKAIADEYDVQQIIKTVGALSGVREADVKSVEQFPGGQSTER